MRKVLLVSPHFDDAILSVGQFMADRPDTEVVTVFAGEPYHGEDVKTDYDQKCGFTNAKDAVAERQRENDAATALLDATAINLPFLDNQYIEKYHDGPKAADIAAKIQKIVDEGDYEYIMGPLGLGHPDHTLTTEALIHVQTDLPVYLWEDLPLRVMEPELVWTRLAMFGLGSKSQLNQPATTGDKVAKKVRALMCYKSQIGTGILDPYLLYVPERIWKLK